MRFIKFGTDGIRGKIGQNPITLEDFYNETGALLDPENLISVSLETHNAIHYGSESNLPYEFTQREPGDTKLW